MLNLILNVHLTFYTIAPVQYKHIYTKLEFNQEMGLFFLG
jgi:hypothetical protein